MKRTVSLRKTILIGALCVLFGIILTLGVIYAFLGERAKTHLKLAEIDFLANRHFYGELKADDLDTAIFQGYASALGDKYAQYLPKADAKVNFDALDGNKNGIGVTISMHPDTEKIYVINVSEGGPAYKAGLRAGDQITAVRETEVTRSNYVECTDFLIGEIGEEIKLSVLRGKDAFDIGVTVNYFEVQSVFYHTVGEYGYIQITEFNESSVSQFKIALNTLMDSGVKGLIFDVTNNGGGTVDSVAAILDILLPEGVIVSAEYADGSSKVLHKSDKGETLLPMAVLTNERTASAAELFAISIRDYEKGILIGQPTFGKGIMQTTYRLSDGSSIRFTVGKFFSKSKTDFTNGGIIPDKNFALTDYESKYRYVLKDSENPYIVKAVEWLNEQ